MRPYTSTHRTILKSLASTLVLLGALLAALSPVTSALAAEQVRIGILAVRPNAQTQMQWQPLATALKRAVPERDFVIEALNINEVGSAIASRRLDFILTNGVQYVELNSRYGLSAPLATLATLEYGQALSVSGGTIFTRADQDGISTLSDLKGRTIAVDSDELSLGGYLAQAYELKQAGVILPQDATLLTTGLAQDTVVNAVLEGKADAGFVNNGMLESMVREGKLDLSRIKIINQQNLPGYPVLVSTHLYPNWAFASIPGNDENIARRIIATLFKLEEDTATTRAIGIHGFVVPTDYTPIRNLMQELRIPPFDISPEFTASDVLHKYRAGIIFTVLGGLVILLLGLWLLILNRRLAKERQIVLQQGSQLLESNQMLDSIVDNIPNMIFLKRAQDLRFTLLNRAGEALLGQQRTNLIGKNDYDFFPPEQADAFTGKDREVLAQTGVIDIPEESITTQQGTRILHTKKLALRDERDIPRYLLGISEDITELVSSKEALVEANRLFKGMAEASPLAIYTSSSGLEQKAEYINPAFTRLFGYTLEDVPTVAEWWPRAYPDESYRQRVASEWREKVAIALENKTAIEPVETKVTCKDGTERIVSWGFISTELVDCSFGLDLTEYRRLEAQILKEKDQAQTYLDVAGVMLVVLDTEGNITLINRKGCEILGYSEQEVIGRNWFELCIPEDMQETIRNVFHQLMAGKTELTEYYENPILNKRGERRVVAFHNTLVKDADGSPSGLLSSGEDVTERRLTEERLRRSELELKRAQQITHIGSWYLDVASNEVVWSEELYKMYGFDPALPPPPYTEHQKLFTPESWSLLSASLASTVETGVPYELELRTVRDDGSHGWMWVRGETVLDEAGKTLGLWGAAQDISARKEAELVLKRYKDHLEEEVEKRTTELVLARDAAEAANRAKSAFLASMSHELRTPLNAILGFSNLMRRDAQLSAVQRDTLNIINHSGNHLLGLINDVLEMAKIESGKVKLESAAFDLALMLHDVTDMMHIRAEEKGLQLLVDQSPDCPRYIKGDEPRLRQVLINLLGNAIKFTEHGSVVLHLMMVPNGRLPHLLISVEDSGPGISAEDQSRLFKPFVQLGKQAGDNQGSGLGLTITRQFVELMGGTISVDSTLGRGSTFRIELPVMAADAADMGKQEEVKHSAVVGLVPGQPSFRILIVEDQLENQLLLKRLMDIIGIQSRLAENGKQGVEQFQAWQPHLILMDRRMPVMDGIEATKVIRALPGGKEVKIVAVTASAFKEEQQVLLDAGMDDFVSKPYRFNEIYECLTRQLGVQFIYEESPEARSAQPPVALTPEMLSVLPPALRGELKTALESLDSERIESTVALVADIDPTLHKTLSKLIADFDYPAILEQLKTIGTT
ncbi:MAG: PAS domain S-box protein [Pseudomonadota bacterium]